MAGSLLICQQIQATEEELRKITGGSFLSPGDIVAGSSDPESQKLQKELTASLASARERETKAKEEAARSQRLSVVVAAGSLLVAATGLYLSWRSSHQNGR